MKLQDNEEIDFIHCKKEFERPCQLVASHRNIGDMATVRVILYTRNPLRMADEFLARAKRARQPIA